MARKFKFVNTIEKGDGTSRVRFRDNRPDLVKGGAAVELSDEERARLSSRLVLEAEGAESSSGPKTTPSSSPAGREEE